ncbi:MAG: HepT-like ribonuclease domain-containing protein [Microcoleaceae cyanobacterium]
MSRDRETIEDMILAGESIMLSMDRVSFQELSTNQEKQAAILYFIIILGEATKRLSKNFRTAHPAVDWQSIAGMRDVLVHQYDRIDIETVWDVVQTDLPPLLESLRLLLGETL